MEKINKLLKEHNLLHFKFYEDGAKLVYTHVSGTSSHVVDYEKLVRLLKDNNIAYESLGIDVLLVKVD